MTQPKTITIDGQEYTLTPVKKEPRRPESIREIYEHMLDGGWVMFEYTYSGAAPDYYRIHEGCAEFTPKPRSEFKLSYFRFSQTQIDQYVLLDAGDWGRSDGRSYRRIDECEKQSNE